MLTAAERTAQESVGSYASKIALELYSVTRDLTRSQSGVLHPV